MYARPVPIAPSDAAVAARSFPRRWRALFARAAGDGESSDVLHRSGAPDLAARAARALGATAVDDPLAALDAEAIRFAEAIEATPSGEWDADRVGVVSAAVEEAASLLREAERAIDAARAGRAD
jgi:hypothetical protein